MPSSFQLCSLHPTLKCILPDVFDRCRLTAAKLRQNKLADLDLQSCFCEARCSLSWKVYGFSPDPSQFFINFLHTTIFCGCYFLLSLTEWVWLIGMDIVIVKKSVKKALSDWNISECFINVCLKSWCVNLFCQNTSFCEAPQNYLHMSIVINYDYWAPI